MTRKGLNGHMKFHRANKLNNKAKPKPNLIASHSSVDIKDSSQNFNSFYTNDYNNKELLMTPRCIMNIDDFQNS